MEAKTDAAMPNAMKSAIGDISRALRLCREVSPIVCQSS
jgi:hypothetical protein